MSVVSGRGGMGNHKHFFVGKMRNRKNANAALARMINKNFRMLYIMKRLKRGVMFKSVMELMRKEVKG